MGTGTGKTLTSIIRHLETPPEHLLVICPKGVVTQWEHVLKSNFDVFNINKYSKKNLTAEVKNKEIKTFIQSNTRHKVIVTNFEIVHKLTNLKNINDKWTIIIDESHRIKSPKTKVSKAVLALAIRTPWKMILTATPTQGVKGGYVDYYTQLKFIDQLNYGFETFERNFIKYNMINYGNSAYPVKTITGYVNTDKIDAILSSSCKYYKPKFRDEPPFFNKIVFDKPESYDKLLREKAYKDISITSVAKKRYGLLTLLGGSIAGYTVTNEKRIYVDNTIKKDWLVDFLKDTDENVVIFYRYNVELDLILEACKEAKKHARTINGKTKDKYAEIGKDWDVLVGQFQAMSESLDGIHLKSHIEIFYSMPDSSLLYQQAIGRIDRDGQPYVPVYYFLVVEKTLDDAIYNMIEEKIEFSSKTLDKIVLDFDTSLPYNDSVGGLNYE